MSALPPYRPTLPGAYAARASSKVNKDTLRPDGYDISENATTTKKVSPDPQRRARVLSTSAYEGLVIDRSPEESERMSRKFTHFLDKNHSGAPSLLGGVKGKVRATMENAQRKTSTHVHCATVPSTTIFTRQWTNDGASDSALANRNSCQERSDSDNGDHSPPETFVVDDPEKGYAQFMQAHRCYDVIPMNAKLVILDTNLDVSKAFYGLVYNSVRSALLWNSVKERLCGMLTITDFILILLRLYRTEKATVGKNLEKHLIIEWRDMLKKEGKLKKLTTVNANTSLYRAVQVLSETKYHRIPVLDETSGNPLYFLTHKRILRFLYLYLEQLPRPSFMHESVRTLGVGTYDDLQYVHPDTPLVECLAKLTSRHMSAVPVIVKDTHCVVDIYARFDAIGLAAQQSYDNLDKTVAEALQHRKLSNWYEGVLTCLETDSLWEVVKKLVLHEVHGLVVVNSKNVLQGVLTLSDVLRYMVLRPIIEKDIDEEVSL